MTATTRGAPAIMFAGLGTLFDFSSVARAMTGAIAGRTEFVRCWSDEIAARLADHTGGPADYWHVVGEALDRTLHSFGIEDAVARARLMQKVLAMDPYADVAPALAALKSAGRRLAVLTNMTMTMVVSALKHGRLMMPVDAAISTEHGEAMKPDPSVYVAAAEQLRLEPSEVCYVTASAPDAEGAARADFNVIFLDRGGSNDRPRGIDQTISSLEELPRLIGKTAP